MNDLTEQADISQMVTRAYYESEERVYGRHGGRGHGYPLSHDRDLPASSGPYNGSRNHQLSLQESRNSGQVPDQDSASSHPRRRIPVACGRCRKRKIRCSGDPGNGGPCSGCKAAGNELCQFLRVLSTEAQMRPDAVEYSYNSTPAGPRVNCRMVPYGTQAYAPPAIPLGADGFPYRQNSLAYPYQGKGYYGLPPYGEFAEESIDYGLHSTSYPILGADNMNIGSTYTNIGRGWTSALQVPRNHLLFLGEESTYSHAHVQQYPNSAYALRPVISPDSKSISLSGMSNSLPALVHGTDRLLPMPAHRTFLRSDDGQPVRGLNGMHPYSDLLNSNVTSSSKSLTSNSASENGSISSPYIPLSQSSPEALPPTSINCSSQNASTSHQQSDLYNHNNSGRLYNSIATSSSEDLHSGNYGVVSPSSKRPLHDNQAEGSGSSPSPGDLASGHSYVPYQHQSYPAPPMEMPVPVTHRRSEKSIQAGV